MTKSYTLMFFMLTLFCGLNAQNNSYIEQFKQQLLQDNETTDFNKDDLSDISITKEYTDLKTGITHIYLQQNYKGIPIFNAIGSMHLKAGNLVTKTTRFINNLDSKVVKNSVQIDPLKSIQIVAQHLGVQNVEINPNSTRDETDGYIFDEVSFTNLPVKVKQTYVFKEGSIKRAWNVETDMNTSADYWATRIDANDGSVLDQNNYTIYCNFDHSGIVSPNHTHAPTEESSVRADGASYRIYPLPAESPIHGEHTLVVDPASPEASPLGWHDTDGVEGPEKTITYGNNVRAYLDKNDDNLPDGGEPDGGESLTFDFPHDLNATPATNDMAAQVNLFYMNNMMHDLTYILGFDEIAGNFQRKNYSNMGNQNDAVEAQASDGSGEDNANFSTPPDGAPGRMQMFLWNNSGGLCYINSPQEIEGLITETGTADFGPAVLAGSITGDVVVATDATSNSEKGCKTLINPSDITGKIALIDRGLCDFGDKTENAQNAGAIALMICNVSGINGGSGEEISNMTYDGNATLTIPTLLFKKSTCDQIRASLANNIPVNVTFESKDIIGPAKFDAAFDNGVIGHEYGHGISNRLVGGPTHASCLGNQEQMGEGWSDFWTVVFTTKEGESGVTPKGIGTYVSGEKTTGRGIRQYPYSTDMSINPLTYEDVKTATITETDGSISVSVHQVGTIWNSMLNDLYWKFIELYGFNKDWTDTNSGNHRLAKLIVTAMKMTPCSPGFVDARDAIFVADDFLNENAHECLIWEVFARRGLGYYADQGSANSYSDGISNFEGMPTCTESLKIKKDYTSIINTEDLIDVSIEITNHIPTKQTNVIVEETLQDGLLFVDGSSSVDVTNNNGKLTFTLGEMDYEEKIVVTFKLRSDPSLETVSLIYDDMENGDDDWEPILIEGDDYFEENADNPYSGSVAWYITDRSADVNQALEYIPFTVTGEQPALKFWHSYITEATMDGGFIQISKDNGDSWEMVDNKFLRNGYNSAVAYTTFAIPSLRGFTGNSGGYIDSYIDLSDYKGEKILVRFRFGTNGSGDAGVPGSGWYIDDFEILDLVKLKSTSCVFSTESDAICAQESLTILNTDNHTNAVQTIESISSFNISPNPAKTNATINIEADNTSNSLLTVYSIDGQQISTKLVEITKGKNAILIPLANLSNGQYMINLSNNEGQINSKLTVIK